MFDREILIGKAVKNIEYGLGTITDVKKVQVTGTSIEYEGIFVLFESHKEIATYRFPDAFYRPNNIQGLAFIDNTVMDALNENFFIDWYGEYKEICHLHPEQLRCRRCKKLRQYSVEEQIEFYKKSGKDAPLCPECRNIIAKKKEEKKSQPMSDAEMKFYTNLMSRPNPKRTKKSWLHNTDGMHLD